MDQKEIAKLRELEAKASPAPWKMFDNEDDQDTIFSVTVRNNLPALLDALDEARSQRDEAVAYGLLSVREDQQEFAALEAERDSLKAKLADAEAERDSARVGSKVAWDRKQEAEGSLLAIKAKLAVLLNTLEFIMDNVDDATYVALCDAVFAAKEQP